MAAVQQELNTTPAGSYHGFSLTQWYGECFIAQKSYVLTKIMWKGFYSVSSAGTVRICVYAADTLGRPTGPELDHADFPISSMSLYPTASWYTVNLTGGVLLSKNNRYCWYIKQTVAGGSPFTYYNTAGYAYGGEISTSNSGVTWSTTGFTTNTDEMMEIWGETRTSVVVGTVTPGDTAASATATIADAADSIDQYGYEWEDDTTGVEPAAFTHSSVQAGSPSSPYTTILTSLLPGHAYWARPKIHLTSYGWVYGAATLFATPMDDAWTSYASYTVGASQQYFSTQYRSYSLFTGITHLMMGVRLKMYRDSTLTGGVVYAAIYATAAGKPTGLALITAQLPEALIATATAAAWYDFGFTGGLQLQDGVVYAIVVWANNGAYSSPMGHWLYGSVASSGGRSQDYGATWIGPETKLHDYYDYGVEGLDVETYGTTDIKYNRAFLWGNINMIGPATEYGFDWSIGTGNFENELLGTDPIIEGLFSILLTGLTFNTAYKFRAKMRATGGAWTYGVTMYFSTSFPVPQCTTEPPTATADHTIDAVGCLESDSEVPVDRYGFVYGCTTVEDMLGRFDFDLDHDYGPEDALADGYDSNEQVTGALTAPLLFSNAASGQANVVVVSATGLSADQVVKLVDTDNEEQLTIDHIVGTTVTMKTNLVNSYTTAKSAQVQGMVTIQLRNLEYGKRYYLRFWAHNQYGYGWGFEICSLTSDTVNIIIPTSTASKGIRFCVPGKVNFPPTGMFYDTRHHLLVRAPDSYFDPDIGAFGWVIGKYVCERQYWWEATNVDLYAMSNPSKRTNTVIKVKYKTRIGNNSYGLGSYHKRVINNGASSLTSAYIGSGMGNPGWYCEIFYNNPWTSAPWDITEIDDLQMGISIRSGTGFEIPMCDCIEGRVIWANAAVTTKTAYQVSPTLTRFRALVTEDEAEDCEVYFEYGPTAAYGTATDPQAAVKGQYIYADITSPPAGAEYHYRAVITTDCGETFYGADKSYPNRMYLELAFEQSILTVAPVWTDVTPYCMKLHTQMGRNHELDRCDAGTGTFLLNNASGDWWRLNTAGALYGSAGGVKPLTLVRLRYVYDDEFFLFYGVAESFKPGWLSKGSGFHPMMELKAVDVFKSFTRYKIVDANPALVEDASSGEDFVYVDSVRGLVEGQSIKIYEGDTTQTTTILQIIASMNLVIFDDVLATDFSTNAKLKKFPTVLSGRRIQDILLEAKWPLALTTIDDGQVMVVELTPGTGGDNAMDELYKTQEAECGNLFVAGNGKVTFQDSIAMTKSPFNTSQGTFKDDGTLCKFYDPELSDDDEFIYNESNISGDAIGEQIMLDSDAQDDQGPRSLDRKDSRLSDPDDAFDQVTINVERYKESIQRCSGLIIRPEGDPDDSWPRVLGYGLGTRITLELNSTRNPAMIDIDRHVMGVTHDWSVWDPWETKWQLWDTNRHYVFRSNHEGWIREVRAEPYTYQEIHDAAAGAFVYNDGEPGGTDPLQIGQVPYVAFSYNEDIRRGQLQFDTSKLDAGWTIASAKLILMLKPQLELWDRKAFDLCIVTSYMSNEPVVLADYGNMGDQNDIFGSVTVPADFKEQDPFHPVGVYMIVSIELSAAGIAHINKGGTSRFWLRSDHDINSTEPSGGEGEWVKIEGHLGAFPPRLLVQLA